MAKLFLIPEENAAQVWPLAEEFIERACKYSQGLLLSSDLEASVADGTKQLWIVWEDECRGAGVTSVINSTCFVWAFGGTSIDEFLPLCADVEVWAKENGCDAVQFFGRLGWERVMRSIGYERKMVVLRKEL